MKAFAPLLAPLAFCSCVVVSDHKFSFGTFPECEHTAPRSATVDANGATRVRVEAQAGSLRIQGRPDIFEVRVSGTACASRRDLLDEIRLAADRRGGEVRIVADLPDHLMNASARLDLVIEVPESLPLDVEDGSGGIEIHRVAALRLRDGSGKVRIEDVGGDLRVEDNSGELSAERIGGDVWVSDGSGGLRIRGVDGSVIIEEDGSGEIVIEDVEGDVRVREDGSGSIRAARVGGDFTVGRDGSGGIRHQEIRGRVRLP